MAKKTKKLPRAPKKKVYVYDRFPSLPRHVVRNSVVIVVTSRKPDTNSDVRLAVAPFCHGVMLKSIIVSLQVRLAQQGPSGLGILSRSRSSLPRGRLEQAKGQSVVALGVKTVGAVAHW